MEREKSISILQRWPWRADGKWMRWGESKEAVTILKWELRNKGNKREEETKRSEILKGSVDENCWLGFDSEVMGKRERLRELRRWGCKDNNYKDYFLVIRKIGGWSGSIIDLVTVYLEFEIPTMHPDVAQWNIGGEKAEDIIYVTELPPTSLKL